MIEHLDSAGNVRGEMALPGSDSPASLVCVVKTALSGLLGNTILAVPNPI